MTSQSCHIPIGGFGRFPTPHPPEDPFEITPEKGGTEQRHRNNDFPVLPHSNLWGALKNSRHNPPEDPFEIIPRKRCPRHLLRK
ncbi:hypothetical protein CEXT_641031 [Caerostris extrusa]|uniref:Uncharacterized protein n=1 Tax=Caerostris extrusa TaxID=172846 RepID=A0AAV4MV39_CAEEX|nr:hypothetical protein CEXT_641031 [Caerostris extrusa]